MTRTFYACFLLLFLCCSSTLVAQNYQLNNALNNSTVNTCAGNFYDSGGPGGQYNNGQNLTVTFCPDVPGQVITVAFSQLQVENNFDRLRVYDGPNTTSPLIANNTGNVTIGNLTVANTTISTSLVDGNITLDPTGNAIVEITGTGGVSIPSGDTSERPAPAIEGTLRYNTDSGIVEIYNGSSWISVGANLSVISNQTIEGDGSTDTFTLDQEATAAGIIVTINGVSQTPGVDYDVTSGDQITFTSTPIVSDTVQVRFISSITTVSALTNTSGNTTVTTTSTGNIDFEINSSTVAQITNASILDISAAHSLQLPAYTVSQASGLSNVATGQVIYVSDGASGSPCLAVYSGGGWKQIAIGSAITS